MLDQSFTDYEIILVDDGSTDSTGSLADRAASLHKNIKVLHQENAGLGAARNTGIQAARGRYLCFYDIDDSVGPHWLKTIHEEIADLFPQICVYGYREINERYHTSVEFTFPRMILSTNEEIGKVFPRLLSGLKFNNGFAWNKVYERDFILKHDIRFPDIKIQQDEVFNHRAYRHADSLLMIPEVLYDYYVYEAANNRSRFIPDRLQCFIAVRNSFLNLLNYWHCDDADVIDYVHSRFVFNSLFNRNPHRDSKSHKEDISVILKAPELAQSAEILKANDFRKYSSWMKLYMGCIERQSLKGMFLVDCLHSLTGKIKNCLRALR